MITIKHTDDFFLSDLSALFPSLKLLPRSSPFLEGVLMGVTGGVSEPEALHLADDTEGERRADDILFFKSSLKDLAFLKTFEPADLGVSVKDNELCLRHKSKTYFKYY